MSTILLVEHDATVRNFLRKSTAGQYEVLEAATPVEALDLCRVRPDIDALVCDTELGLVSGMELASLLQAWNSRLLTVLLSDVPCDQWTERQQMELDEIGSDDVLVLEKPFSPCELNAALAALMSVEAVPAF